MTLRIYNMYRNPIVWVSVQKKLECHREDSQGSKGCPIYTKPIKEAYYLSFSEQVRMKWQGGRNLCLETPAWWQETYNEAKTDWVLSGGSLNARFRADKPIGGVGHVSGHAGGIVVNCFTGLSMETPKGYKLMVTHPFNQPSPVWSLQTGIYDSDTFVGDFSVNFQMMLQDREVVLQRGEPFASLFIYREVEEDSSVDIVSYPASREREMLSRGFYNRKALGVPYQANISTS